MELKRIGPDTSKWSIYRMEQAEYDCYPQRQYYDETSDYHNVFLCDRHMEEHPLEDIVIAGSMIIPQGNESDIYATLNLNESDKKIQEQRTKNIVKGFNSDEITKKHHTAYDPEVKTIKARIRFDPTGEKETALAQLMYIAKEADTDRKLMATGRWRKEAAAIINTIKGRAKIQKKYDEIIFEN